MFEEHPPVLSANGQPYPMRMDPAFAGPPYGSIQGPLRQEVTVISLLEILRRRWIYLVLCLLISWALAFRLARHQVPVYSATATLEITPPSDTVKPQDVFDAMMGMSTARTVETQVEILKGPSLLMQAVQQVHLTPAEAKHLRLNVTQNGNTSLVDVTVQADRPAIAAAVANALAKVYLDSTLSQNQLSLVQTRSFLSKQLQLKGRRLEAKERELEATKRRLGITDINEDSTQEANTLAQMQADLRNASLQRIEAANRVRSISEQLMRTNPTVVGAVMTTVNPIVTQLQSKLADLETQRTALLKEFQPDQVEVVTVDTQIKDIQDRLRGELQKTIVSGQQTMPNPLDQSLKTQLADARTDLTSQGARERALSAAVADMRGQVSQLPWKDRIINGLTREVKALSDSYDDLNQKYQKVQMDQQAKIADGKLIEAATLPDGPDNPRRRLILIAATAVGLIAGLLLIMTMEGIDGSIRDPQEIERVGLTVLAGIPRAKLSPNPMRALGQGGKRSRSSSALEEGVRLLQAGVAFSNASAAAMQSIMLTSPLPGEGKTTVAGQLGKTIAESGKRVVVADVDFRKPGLTRQWSAVRRPGFTNLLSDTVALEQVLIPTENPDLVILPTGPLPENPPAFIQSPAFAKVLDRLKAEFDCVILDAPNLMVTDGLFLSRYAEAVILVAVPGKTPKVAIDRAVSLLTRVNANLIGICLNKVTRSNCSSYRSYIYGDYHYGTDNGRRALSGWKGEGAPPDDGMTANGDDAHPSANGGDPRPSPNGTGDGVRPRK